MDRANKASIKPDDEVWYVQMPWGAETGPVSQVTWLQWLREQRVNADTPVTTSPPTVDIAQRPWMKIGDLIRHFRLDQPRPSPVVAVAKPATVPSNKDARVPAATPATPIASVRPAASVPAAADQVYVAEVVEPSAPASAANVVGTPAPRISVTRQLLTLPTLLVAASLLVCGVLVLAMTGLLPIGTRSSGQSTTLPVTTVTPPNAAGKQPTEPALPVEQATTSAAPADPNPPSPSLGERLRLTIVDLAKQMSPTSFEPPGDNTLPPGDWLTRPEFEFLQTLGISATVDDQLLELPEDSSTWPDHALAAGEPLRTNIRTVIDAAKSSKMTDQERKTLDLYFQDEKRRNAVQFCRINREVTERQSACDQRSRKSIESIVRSIASRLPRVAPQSTVQIAARWEHNKLYVEISPREPTEKMLVLFTTQRTQESANLLNSFLYLAVAEAKLTPDLENECRLLFKTQADFAQEPKLKCTLLPAIRKNVRFTLDESLGNTSLQAVQVKVLNKQGWFEMPLPIPSQTSPPPTKKNR